jgi:hypothetical protein
LNGAIQYRDPVDVLNDLEVLERIIHPWAAEVQEEFKKSPSLTPRVPPADRSHLPGLPDGALESTLKNIESDMFPPVGKRLTADDPQ